MHKGGHRASAVLVATGLLLAACGERPAQEVRDREEQEEPGPTAEELLARAEALCQEALVVDTHIDTPYRMLDQEVDISGPTDRDFDYPKAVMGGLNAAFMSVYVPSSYQEEGGAYEHAEMQIDMVEGFVAAWPEKFAIAHSPAEVREQARQGGLVSLPMGLENGAPIRELSDLAHFHRRGIRYVTLTHGEDNQISDSSFADTATWGGLSDYGREVVAEMNRLGVMVDVSHVSDEAFWDALEVSSAPMIASHSSARRFTPDFLRNMSDEMIVALAEAGGVIQINFGSSFLTPEASAYLGAFRQAREREAEARGLDLESDEMQAWMDRYREEHPYPFADVSDVADHVEHVVAIAGVDHVGLGSDYDGVGDSLPTGLKDVSEYPNLVAELLRRGWSEEDLRKVLAENLLRVWEEVERIAADA